MKNVKYKRLKTIKNIRGINIPPQPIEESGGIGHFLIDLFLGIVFLFGAKYVLEDIQISNFITLFAFAILLCLGLSALAASALTLTGVRAIEHFFDAVIGLIMIAVSGYVLLNTEDIFVHGDNNMSTLLWILRIFLILFFLGGGIIAFRTIISNIGTYKQNLLGKNT